MTNISPGGISGMRIPAVANQLAPWTFASIALHGTDELQVLAHCLHKERGRRGVPFWKDYCYLPVNIATDLILNFEASGQLPFWCANDTERTFFTHDFSCAAAWNLGKGMYRLDPPYLEGLWAAPCTDVLPVADLLALPEWCIYVECAGRTSIGRHPVEGFFAFLDDRFSDGERFWPELQIVALLRQEGHYLVDRYRIPLVRGKTLTQALDLLAQRAEANGAPPTMLAAIDQLADDYSETVGSFITVLASLNGFCREMQRLKAFEYYPRRKKVAFDASGLPVCEPQGHMWEVGDPSTAPAAAH